MQQRNNRAAQTDSKEEDANSEPVIRRQLEAYLAQMLTEERDRLIRIAKDPEMKNEPYAYGLLEKQQKIVTYLLEELPDYSQTLARIIVFIGAPKGNYAQSVAGLVPGANLKDLYNVAEAYQNLAIWIILH
jgi:hypothetical protein